METKAKAKFIKMSPRKVRLVVDVVRGLKAEEALDRLKLTNKAAVKPISKLINSAIADAEHNFELKKENLFIKEIKVNEAPTLKRWMPRAHGRATTIRKRNSHISITLAEIKDSGSRKGRKPETGEVVKLKEKPKQEDKPAQSASRNETGKDKKSASTPTASGLQPASQQGGRGKVETEKSDKDIFDKLDEIHDPIREGRRGHARAEGGRKGFVNKIFRRKSG